VTSPVARARRALLILSPVLLMTAVSVVVSLIVLANLGSPSAAGPDAGLARVGDDLALVLVADGAAEVATARRLVANWGLLVPAVVLVVSAFVAWAIAGRVQREVDEATRSIGRADKRRETHLQEIAHELRTPLAVIGTNLELASDGDESGRYIDAAQRAMTRMSRTVDDLAGHGHLAVEDGQGPVDLADVVGSVAQEHVGPGRERGVFVRLSGGPDLVVEDIDPAAVRAVLSNFMSNAMRYAPRGSVVGVDWGAVDEWFWLSVSDQGPGIASRDHARVFERGWQGNHDRDRRSGSGLGMTIARQLTEAQGGHVTLDSEEGGGATFTLWLPGMGFADPADVIAADGIHPAVRPWIDQLASV
jgi:signal transduction histidine kinase